MTEIVKSIIVPCYNEAPNLPALLDRFAVHSDNSRDWELLVVDNGSTDGTPAVLSEELKRPNRAFVRVVTVGSPNVGYGHGIMAGLRAARGSLLAWTHADGQTPPADVFRAFELLQAATDPQRTFIKGSRTGRPLGDSLFTGGMQVAALLMLGRNLADINGQPKAFGRALLELATDPPTDLSLDLYFFHLATIHGFSAQTFPVEFGAREHGESKWASSLRSKAKHVGRSLRYMARLRSS